MNHGLCCILVSAGSSFSRTPMEGVTPPRGGVGRCRSLQTVAGPPSSGPASAPSSHGSTQSTTHDTHRGNAASNANALGLDRMSGHSTWHEDQVGGQRAQTMRGTVQTTHSGTSTATLPGTRARSSLVTKDRGQHERSESSVRASGLTAGLSGDGDHGGQSEPFSKDITRPGTASVAAVSSSIQRAHTAV